MHLVPASFFKCRKKRRYNRRTLRGRQPLWRNGVSSQIAKIEKSERSNKFKIVLRCCEKPDKAKANELIEQREQKVLNNFSMQSGSFLREFKKPQSPKDSLKITRDAVFEFANELNDDEYAGIPRLNRENLDDENKCDETGSREANFLILSE